MAPTGSRTLRIGVYQPGPWPLSVRQYVEAVSKHAHDVKRTFFASAVPSDVNAVKWPEALGVHRCPEA